MLSEDQFIAASIGDIDWLQQTISKGTIKYDKNGLSTLHLAAMHGHLNCMKLLVEEYDFDVDLTAKNGNTALQLAINTEAEKCSLPCVSYLLDKGANPSLHGDEGTTALHRAASQGHLIILQLLLDCGAKVDCKDNNGHIPLDLAKMWGHERCGKILKASMWHKDKEYIAIQMKRLHLIKQQLSIRRNGSEGQKEIKERTRTKQGATRKQQKQISTNNEVLDDTTFTSSIKTSTIQADKTTGKEVKRKHSRPLSKTKQTWKPFAQGRPPRYVPNLKDPMHKSKNEANYFDGNHKDSPVYLKTLFNADDQLAHFQLPDLPSDIIAKGLASDLTEFERPLDFKCKYILDVQAKWKPPNFPKNEVPLHLSSDTSSVVFQNSLQPNTKVFMVQNREEICTSEYSLSQTFSNEQVEPAHLKSPTV